MKTFTPSSPTAARSQSSQPFFAKGGEAMSFWSEKSQESSFFNQPRVQPKLKVGPADDHYEQQADAVAHDVVAKLNSPQPVNRQAPAVQPTAPSTTPSIQAKCASCEQKEKLQKKEDDIDRSNEKLQRKPIFESGAEPPEDTVQRCEACEAKEKIQKKGADSSETAPPDVVNRLNTSKGSGSSLSNGVRAPMESAMGADFSNVRVHTGSEASQLSQDLGAHAFTHGNDIYFNAGNYNPSTSDGQRLLAHELTHTIQQGKSTRKDSGTANQTQPESSSAEVASPPGSPSNEVNEDGSVSGEIQLEEPEVKSEITPNSAAATKGSLTEEMTVQGEQKGALVKQQMASQLSPEKTAAATGKRGKKVSKASAGSIEQGQETVGMPPRSDKLAEQTTKSRAAFTQSQQTYGELSVSRDRAKNATALRVRFTEPEENAGSPPPTSEQADLQAYATNTVNGFISEMSAYIYPLLNLSDTVKTSLDLTAESVKATIRAAVENQKAAVTARIAQASSLARAQAESTRNQIEGQHDTTVASIQATSLTSQAILELELQAALLSLSEKETNQLQNLNRLYTNADGRYRQAGVTVGREAVAIGNQMASEYRSHKINEMDSLTDGYLTDRRCDARANAAEEVSKQYSNALIQEANKQADEALKGKDRDYETVRTTIQQSTEALRNHYDATLQGIRGAEQQAIQQANDTKNGLLQSTNAQLRSTEGSLRDQLTTHLQTLDDLGRIQTAQIDEAAQQAIASLLTNLNQTVTGLLDQVFAFHSMLDGKDAPDIAELNAKVEVAREQISQGITIISQSFSISIDTAGGTLTTSGQSSVEGIANTVNTIMEGIASAETSFGEAMRGIRQNADTSFTQQKAGHSTNSLQTTEDGRNGFGQIMMAIDGSFTQLNTALENTFNQAIPGLETALRGSFDGPDGMRTAIQQKAQEAAAAEQPAWKSIVKWVLIIAVVIVVALVVGPAVIGAVGAYLGAGTLATTVVAGAIVGAATSATIQVINNVVDGQTWYQGVGKAALIGAIGGAAGGALGFGLNSLATQVGGRAFAQHIATQLVMEQIGNAAVDLSTQLITTGHISWHDFGIGVLMSLGTFGLTRSARGHAISERFQQRGADIGQGVRARLSAPATAPHVEAPTAPTAPRPEVEPAPATHPEPTSTPHPEADAPAPHAESEPRPTTTPEQPATAHVEEPTPTAPRSESEPTTPHPETEPTAPHAESEPSAGRPAEEAPERSTHEGHPVDEDGAVTREQTADGHEVKVLEDGRLIKCSTCGEIRKLYESELNNHPELRQQLSEIEGIANARTKASRAVELERRLAAIREQGGNISHPERTSPIEWPPAAPSGNKPGFGETGALEYRYRRYLSDQFKAGKSPTEVLTLEQYRELHFIPTSRGGRPGRRGGPEQLATKGVLANEGVIISESIPLGGHNPDGIKRNASGGNDYFEVGKTTQEGIPVARERGKLQNEINALGENDSITFVNERNPSERTVYRNGDTLPSGKRSRR